MRPILIAGLMLAATPVAAATVANGPFVKNGVEITVLQPVAAAGGSPGVLEVTLDVEARSDEAAAKLGYRSMRGVTAIDCRLGSNRFIKADAYALADLKGPATARVVSGEWVKPAPESYMSPITARVCAGPAPQRVASGPLPVVRMGMESTPTSKPPRAAPTAGADASAAPVTAATSPARMAMAIAPQPAQAAAPPPAFRARAGGRGVAQVAASTSAAAAQHVLDRLHALITPPLTAGVEPATVNNAAIFRASVSGFVSLGDAQAFCARAGSVSKTCWVHWKTADPAPAPHHG